MKENNEVMSTKTKENKIQEVKQVIEKVVEKKESKYKRGDTVTANGKNCKVVEVIAIDRWHLKNLESPFDSFIVTEDDLAGSSEKEQILTVLNETIKEFGQENFAKSLVSKDDPDLLAREDDRLSL
jgi:hypothetical protein